MASLLHDVIVAIPYCQHKGAKLSWNQAGRSHPLMILQTGTTATTQALPNQRDEMEQRTNVVN